MATIYRVEHPVSRKGPYNHHKPDGTYVSSGLVEAHSTDDRHLSPYLETGHYMTVNEKSGFRTMRQLFAWFGGWLPVLLRDGLTVAVYRDVTVVAESPSQLVFRTAEN